MTIEMKGPIGFEDYTRTDWIVDSCKVSEEDAHLLLAFKYFIATRNQGLSGSELTDAMEDWVDEVCGMTEDKVKGLLNILKEGK